MLLVGIYIVFFDVFLYVVFGVCVLGYVLCVVLLSWMVLTFLLWLCFFVFLMLLRPNCTILSFKTPLRCLVRSFAGVMCIVCLCVSSVVLVV